MNLITKDSDYAIRALSYMAARPRKTIIAVSELTDNLEIPRPYLRRILQTLSRGGILRSYRGISGGFELIRQPNEIHIVELVELFQGPLELTRCIFRKRICARLDFCPVRKKILEIQGHALRELRKISIASLVTKPTRTAKRAKRGKR